MTALSQEHSDAGGNAESRQSRVTKHTLNAWAILSLHTDSAASWDPGILFCGHLITDTFRVAQWAEGGKMDWLPSIFSGGGSKSLWLKGKTCS